MLEKLSFIGKMKVIAKVLSDGEIELKGCIKDCEIYRRIGEPDPLQEYEPGKWTVFFDNYLMVAKERIPDIEAFKAGLLPHPDKPN